MEGYCSGCGKLGELTKQHMLHKDGMTKGYVRKRAHMAGKLTREQRLAEANAEIEAKNEERLNYEWFDQQSLIAVEWPMACSTLSE